jgi:GABA(A) receptor-associated protein
MVRHKEEFDLNYRISESNRILTRYPDKIPVIIDCSCNDLNNKINKKKFLVPKEISVSYLISMIRNKSQIDSKKALFMFCNNKMISGTAMLGTIYDEFLKTNISSKKDNDVKKGDKFLYISLAYENTFG